MTQGVDRTGASLREWTDRRYRDEVWAPLTLRPNAWSTTRHDDIARLTGGERGRLLDVGCGAGQLVMALADQFDSLVGVDISGARIRLADSVLAQRYPHYVRKVTFQVGPAAPLPFPDGSFDVVVACVVLEVVPDVFLAMDEIARVCRPNGCLVATVANVCYLKHAVGMLAGRIPLTWSATRDMAHWRTDGWDGGCVRYFSQAALRDLLRHTGFAPEAWSGSGAFAKLRRWYLNSCGSLTVRARRLGRENR